MNETRNIKDSLFVALFNNEDAARELYNAIYGTHYGPEVPVTITTLDNILYRGIKNDVSFIVGTVYMTFFEQQSSFNHNVPLRILLYIARVYEQIIPNKEMHKDKLYKVPRPCPVVFYTGRDSGKSMMEQDSITLYLSDAFMGEPNPFGSLELEVLVLNITPGHNEELLRRAPRLRGYMDFITCFRENKQTLSREEAVLAAVDWCIAHDILADFFRLHRKEVSNMILNELTNEDALQAMREQTWEEAQQHWEAERQQVFDLIDQGLTSEQIKQALQQSTKTEGSKP